MLAKFNEKVTSLKSKLKILFNTKEWLDQIVNPTLQRRVEEKCEETALVAVLLEGGRDVLHNAITDRTHIHSIPCLT